MEDILLMPRQIIQDLETKKEYRILWVSKSSEPSYWIPLSDAGNTPLCFNCDEVTAGISTGHYAILPDTWSAKDMGDIPETWKQRRDRIWALVKDAVEKEPDIYEKTSRVQITKEIEEKTGFKRSNLYLYLGKYWKGGMTPNALLPNYENCGKSSSLDNPSAKRRGRKKAEGAEGKVLTKQDTQNFTSALKKYYYTKEKISLEKTYQRMLQEYYAVRDNNGDFISLLPPDQIPSREQFLYWHRKNKDVLEEVRARDGERNYNLRYRSSIDKTETFISGPCAYAQIDATVADIYLVRQDDRNAIVGRPTMYFLIDCYSRMVMGMHITLEHPSAQSASRCILNALSDKAEYCAKYGITITPEDWPCRHSPSVIVADRGELESAAFDDIVNKLGISIENMPPFRGDLKAIIEQYFHLIDVAINELPGKMGKDFGERCTEDYRLNAKLNIREFTQIIIQCVLLYNKFHYMESYVKTSQMRQLGVLPLPRSLWNYGLRYCNGAQKIVDTAKCKFVILPKGVGSITDNGILFKGLYYGCERAFQEKWFDCARTEGHTKLSLSYDPEDAGHIYILPDAASAPVECFLLDGNKITEQLTIAEVEQISKLDKENREKHRIVEDTEAVRVKEEIDKIVKNAEKEQPRSTDSKAERIRQIAENRKAEVEAMRAGTPASPNADDDRKNSSVNARINQMDPVQMLLREELDKIIGGEDSE